MSRALIAAAVLAGVVACAAGLVRPTEEDARWAAARWPGTRLADLERGRALYVARCGGCHNLRRPEEFAPDRWPALVSDMGDRIGLAPADRSLIERFLQATSARAGGGK